MTRASAGGWAVAPTAAINPLRMMMLPLSIVGPAIGTMRALVIAYAFGTLRSRCTPICALSNGGAAMMAVTARVIVVRERPVCIADMLLARTACGRLDVS